ncbi:LOW QUALITY PROTEIN: uncharacterized protein ACR2FA_010681 [Aphomia sociella]
MLSFNDELPQSKHTNKFDTQFELDTQLIDIIEKVENNNTEKGVTQEFDVSFNHITIEECNDDKNDVDNNLNDFDVKHNETSNKNCVQNNSMNENIVNNLQSPNVNMADTNKTNNCPKELNEYNIDDKNINVHNQNNIQLEENCTELIDKCMEIESNLNVDEFVLTDRELNASPVLNINNTLSKRSKSSSPLIYNLDSFEKFERIAIPIIEESIDIISAKHLINSQILGKELIIHGNIEGKSDEAQQLSPVIKINRNNIKTPKIINSYGSELVKSKTNFNSVEAEANLPLDIDKHNSISMTEFNNVNKIAEDEILFSSDEEKESKQENIQDLPFTCALQTSFYDRSDVLDKTMYVGFQTASNKSIQISTVSFTKAKSLLNDDEQKESTNNPTLTELVEICDSFSSKHDNTSSNNVNSDKNTEYVSKYDKMKAINIDKRIIERDKELDSISAQMANKTFTEIGKNKADKIFLDYYADTNLLRTTDSINQKTMAEKRKLCNFKTASNKKIRLSDKALATCNRVFQDIDLNETFGDNKEIDENSIKEHLQEKEIIVDDGKENNLSKNCENNFTRGKSILVNLEAKEQVDNNFSGIDDNILQEFQAEMLCAENLENPYTNNNFIGFKTANNKEIKISESALAKSKKMFEDINLIGELDDDIQEDDVSNVKATVTTLEKNTDKIHSISNLSSFKTPITNQDIKPSEVEVSKDSLKNINEIINFDEPSTVNKKIVGFKTANNKTIKVSYQALAQSRRIFQDIDNPEVELNQKISENVCGTHLVLTSTGNKEFVGFKTASNKKIEISEQALSESKKILQDVDNSEVVIGQPVAKNVRDTNFAKPSTSIKDFVGFKTANNKTIKISNQALAESRRIFQDIDDPDQINPKISKDLYETHFDITSTANNKFVGFKTANNKNIKVSEKALAKSKRIFQDIDNPEVKISQEISKNMYETNYYKTSTGNKEFVGFKTANIKKIEVSEQALARTKRLFQDIDYPEVEIGKDIAEMDFNKKSIGTKKMFVGFKTANNKDIKISEQALAKTKNIFSDIDNPECGDMIGVVKDIHKPSSKSGFAGFKTASNKRIKISEQAIAEAKNVFQNIDNNDIVKYAGTKSLEKISEPLLGFKTANNKPVNISNQALQKSKKIFADLEIEQMNVAISRKTNSSKQINKTNNAIDNIPSLEELITDRVSIDNEIDVGYFKGFQTASNKPVKISTEALVKTRNIFKDIDTNYDEDAYNEKVLNEELTGKIDVNKIVKKSSEALAKDRDIFQDIDKAKENFPKRFDKQNIQFKTASKKIVVISDNALEKGRQLLREINSHVNNNTNDISKSNDAKKLIKDKEFQMFSFKTANNDDIKNSEDALRDSKKIIADVTKDSVKNNKKNDKNISLELINTQVMKNFEETMCTEDFLETPKQSKRSGSPILSCPKAKKRKQFTTPYRTEKIEIDTTSKDNIYKQDNETILKIDDTYKKYKKLSLKDIKMLETADKRDIDPYFFKLNYDTLLNIEFAEARNDLTGTKMSVDSLKTYFLKGVNRKLIPDKWLDNHMKLIIWKLISYEVSFPNVMSGICTAGNVLKQLNYRYRRELYNAERPALRKILERDDTPAKSLILCVVDIINIENSDANTKIELLLSDGWYCVKACIDKMLAKYVGSGKIKIGTKLITNGAELLNCPQGIAPWEDTSTVRLKIYGNSTRRARWDARLGYHSNGAILSHLSSVAPDGGKVGRIRVLVTRVYPPLYVEKFVDGSTVTRSDRLEHIHQMKHESDRQALLEKLYEEVQKEVADEEFQESQDIYSSKKSLDSGSQIARHLKNSKDPSQFRANLIESQRNLLEEYNARRRDTLMQDIQARVQSKIEKSGQNIVRNIVPLLKVRVADVEQSNEKVEVTKVSALLSIWKPNDELSGIIIEGAWIEVLNVVPTAVRYSELQLSAGRQAVFKQTTFKQTNKLTPYITSMHRTCYPIKQLTDNPSMITDYNEIDTAGMIIAIDPSNRDFKSSNQFQNVYLTDENKNIICVNFWGGIKKFGYDNVLDTGQIVACINLQKRYGNTKRGVPQYRATEYTYFTKTPRSVATRELMGDLSNKICANKEFLDDCIRIKNSAFLRLQGSNENNISPYRFVNHDNMFVHSPLASNVNQHEFNLTGLDFESTFRQADTQDISPKTLQKKKLISEKIRKLKQYGEPPPLSPLNIINRSKNATSSYKSPLLKSDINNVASTIQTNVTNVKNTPKKCSIIKNSSGSPVLSVKKTFKNVNPVKLNFNSVAMDENNLSEVDYFAGDFDEPPLSLD